MRGLLSHVSLVTSSTGKGADSLGVRRRLRSQDGEAQEISLPRATRPRPSIGAGMVSPALKHFFCGDDRPAALQESLSGECWTGRTPLIGREFQFGIGQTLTCSMRSGRIVVDCDSSVSSFKCDLCCRSRAAKRVQHD